MRAPEEPGYSADPYLAEHEKTYLGLLVVFCISIVGMAAFATVGSLLGMAISLAIAIGAICLLAIGLLFDRSE